MPLNSHFRRCWQFLLLALCVGAWPGFGQSVPQFTFDAEQVEENPREKLRLQGEKALADGLYDQAASIFQQYLDSLEFQEPGYGEAAGKLAEARIGENKLDLAAFVLAEHRKRCQYQHKPEIQAWLTYLGGQVLFLQKRWEECCDYLKPLVEDRTPNLPYRQQAQTLVADSLAQLQQWAKLTDFLTPVLLQVPSTSEFAIDMVLRLGDAYLAQNRFQELKQLLEPLPVPENGGQRFHFLSLQILALTGVQEYDRALELYNQIADLCPAQPDATWWRTLWFLGDALWQGGRHEPCEKVVGQALGVADNDEDRLNCLVRLSEVREKLGRLPEACKPLEEARRLFPNSPRLPALTMRLAELQVKAKNYSQAVLLFAGLRDNETLPVEERLNSGVQQAKCLWEQQDFAAAAEVFLKTAELAGGLPDQEVELLMSAASAYAQAEKLEEALKIYRRVAEDFAAKPAGANARFDEGRILAQLLRHAEARAAFLAFCNSYPRHPLVWEARFQAARSLRLADTKRENLLIATGELRDVAAKCDKQELSVQASLEAYLAAETGEQYELALEILTTLLLRHPDCAEAPLVAYKRLLLHFRRSQWDLALDRAREFLEKYPELPLAANVRLLCGDYYQSQGDFAKASSQYSLIRRPPFQGEIVLNGYFEAARCAEALDKQDEAISLLEGLKKEASDLASTSDKANLLQAKAEMLWGDILSKQGDYEAARRHFEQAALLVGDSELGIAALGRQSEMLMELALAEPALLDKAGDCLTKILNLPAEKLSPSLKEMTRYRLARCLELKGDTEKAMAEYQGIYLAFAADRDNGKPRDWHYYCLSVFALGHILEADGSEASLRLAARIYEDLGNSSLPRSAEAKARAELLRQKHFPKQ